MTDNISFQKESNYGTDRIDIHAQIKLDERQCDCAIAIWKKMGVFETEASIMKVVRDRFDEEKCIWPRTFRNYDIDNEKDYNKMKRFTSQIIERYKDNIHFTGVDRIDFRKNNDAWTIICKPGKEFTNRKYNFGIGTSATNFAKSSKINLEFALNRRSFSDFLQRIDKKVPNLIDRRTLLQEIIESAQQKARDVDDMILLGDAESNGGIITRIEHQRDVQETEPTPINEEVDVYGTHMCIPNQIKSCPTNNNDDICETCNHSRLEHIEGWKQGDGCSHINKAHAQCCSDEYCDCKSFKEIIK